MNPGQAKLLRIYSNANETWHGVPLYRAMVEAARRLKLAGASVFPVELGYGAHRQLHDIASDYTSFQIPIVVEVVETAPAVQAMLAELEGMMSEGLAVASAAQVVRYTHGTERDQAGEPDSPDPQAADQESASAARGTTHMKIEGEGKRVTVYVGSADTWGGRNLAVAIVERCRALGMAGATVSRGMMGFGKHSVIHKAHLLGLSDDLPEKIEIIDQPDQIERLVPALEEMIGGGLIVVEDVHVVRYLHDSKTANKQK